MQENHNKPLKKFISFFKNKFNIFKNKITPTSKQQSNALNHTSPSNNHPIDECYINIKDNNNSNTKITETKTKQNAYILTLKGIQKDIGSMLLFLE